MRIQSIFAFPHKFLFRRAAARAVIEKDIDRWIQYYRPERKAHLVEDNLVWLLENYQDFRNVFYHRIGSFSSYQGRYLLAIAKRLYKPKDTLLIWTQVIGPGLIVRHGFNTGFKAESIGENCVIDHEVSIGYGGNQVPTIGNNVHICAGAKIFGGISIGDNCIVKANAVVRTNVPADCIAAGIPARIMRR